MRFSSSIKSVLASFITLHVCSLMKHNSMPELSRNLMEWGGMCKATSIFILLHNKKKRNVTKTLPYLIKTFKNKYYTRCIFLNKFRAHCLSLCGVCNISACSWSATLVTQWVAAVKVVYLTCEYSDHLNMQLYSRLLPYSTQHKLLTLWFVIYFHRIYIYIWRCLISPVSS